MAKEKADIIISVLFLLCVLFHQNNVSKQPTTKQRIKTVKSNSQEHMHKQGNTQQTGKQVGMTNGKEHKQVHTTDKQAGRCNKH